MRIFTSFVDDSRGSVALMTALLLVPMIVALGAAIDLARSEIYRVEMQSALDRGVLASASLQQTLAAETIVDDYFQSIAYVEDIGIAVDQDRALNSNVVFATASYTFPTAFLGLIGIETMTVAVEAEATDRRQNVEISLILDISASMDDAGRMTALRPAAIEFVETLLPPEAREFVSINLIPFSGQVALERDAFIGLRGSAQYPRSYCFEFDTWTDYGTGAPPFRNKDQTPPFLHGSSARGIDPYWCPLAGSSVVAMSNDPDTLIDRINTMRMFYGTGSAIGANWGLLLLDPSMREHMATIAGRTMPPKFANRPVDYGTQDTVKVMVMMTDGGITIQLRPHLRRCEWDRHFYQYDFNYCYYTQESENTALANMNRVCDAARANNVLVFTIAFQVFGANKNQMRDCATTPSYFYDVDDLEISAAFRAIAATIQQIKLTS